MSEEITADTSKSRLSDQQNEEAQARTKRDAQNPTSKADTAHDTSWHLSNTAV